VVTLGTVSDIGHGDMMAVVEEEGAVNCVPSMEEPSESEWWLQQQQRGGVTAAAAAVVTH